MQTLILPRAELSLNHPCITRLNLSDQRLDDLRQLLNQSALEQRLSQFCKQNNLALQVVPVTNIAPLCTVENLAEPSEVFKPDLLVFVSKHAALLGRLFLPLSILESAGLYAVGPSAKVFFEPEMPVKCPSKADGESLLSLREFQNLDGKQVLICKGEEGLDYIENVCAERGAKLKVVDLYRRQAFEGEEELALGQLHGVYGASGKVLEHLLARSNTDQKTALRALPLYPMSERVAKVASELGFSQIRAEI